MKGNELLLSIVGLLVLAVILALAFRTYVSPAMLLDLSNLQVCS